MANLTIKGIPETTLAQLKKKATANRRSMNQEIIDMLTRYTFSDEPNAKQILKMVDKVKPLFKGKLSSVEIRDAIRKGRK